MKKVMLKTILVASIFVLAISCSGNQNPGSFDKPLTENLPSENKFKKEGTPLSEYNGGKRSLQNMRAQNAEYNLLDRLYSTVWFQSEQDYDDGRLETETEFLFFNKNSFISKREYENGKLDGRDEYSKLKVLKVIDTPSKDESKNQNAIIVLNQELGDDDLEVEGYYLVDENTLFVIEGRTANGVENQLKIIINAVNNGIDVSRFVEDKYTLSTKSI